MLLQLLWVGGVGAKTLMGMFVIVWHARECVLMNVSRVCVCIYEGGGGDMRDL